MSEMNDDLKESQNSAGVKAILQTSRLAICNSSILTRGGVLRPSVLGSATNNASVVGEIGCTKEIASNPFMRDEIHEGDNHATETSPGEGKKKEVGEQANPITEEKKRDDDEEPDDRPDPINLLRKNGLERANLFAAAKNSIPRVAKSGFVFGQNVHERVVGDNINNESANTSELGGGSAPGQLLFSSVIQNAAKSTDNSNSVKATDNKSLTEVAREYEESRAQKRKLEEVETFTGEENETNILDISCKLFAFVNSNYEERGRGTLRLNDSNKEQNNSRVVFRTAGNLRLLINTKIWAGMIAERPSQKSLRLTAMDNTGKIKIFLLMARPEDVTHLHKSLLERIQKRKLSHPEECNTVNDGCEESKNDTALNAAHRTDEDENNGDKKLETANVKSSENVDLFEPSPKKVVVDESTE